MSRIFSGKYVVAFWLAGNVSSILSPAVSVAPFGCVGGQIQLCFFLQKSADLV